MLAFPPTRPQFLGWKTHKESPGDLEEHLRNSYLNLQTRKAPIQSIMQPNLVGLGQKNYSADGALGLSGGSGFHTRN